MKRRDFLKTAGVGALFAGTGLVGTARAQMQAPWAWTAEHGIVNNNMKKDPNPLENEFEKHARCTYCGMMRKQWSHTRHLIQYDDDSAEGTCSIHCLSISLALNMDRGPKNIWVGDAGSDAEVKPLVKVDAAHYVLDASKPGTMSGASKWAYADAEKAKTAATGEAKVVGFDGALAAAYADMAKNTVMIRKRRAEKRAKMMKKNAN
ncbi:nitrous oxide reductase accessory protein NosL [Rhodobium orientis]|uniref:Twin-arginine translocation pathway signal protein n=1 Tax=Rhodobium orientis TaxID=34017 RepID=A0A327JKI8_9HYPH|nr:nitrous oxide reductase accessory protein NosL [Rhodobium orientis]MBB4303865.1 nitrous oxide reductase accessory protein NosL [Rhodobium orientis]MBK5947982.1 hypothetical protein [Rhodobium orientis]RAI25342.1 hypothetical protein CH339_18795 [Rhodobium orientis]